MAHNLAQISALATRKETDTTIPLTWDLIPGICVPLLLPFVVVAWVGSEKGEDTDELRNIMSAFLLQLLAN